MWNSCASVSETLAQGNGKNEIRRREDGKKRGVGMERSKDGTKETEVPMAYHNLIKVQ